MNKKVIYTAIYGNYDKLKEVPYTPEFDYICFTDNENIEDSAPPPWQIVYKEPTCSHPRMSAKYYKLLPHKILQNYDLSLWMDGSIMPKKNFFHDAFAALENTDIALFVHPDRDCIYEEAIVSRRMLKYEDQKIQQQVDYYKEQGFPEKIGLYACGIIGRKHQRSHIKKLGQYWWEENIRWTYQDQLSFPFVLSKLNITPGTFPGNLWNNDWFEVKGHTRND